LFRVFYLSESEFCSNTLNKLALTN